MTAEYEYNLANLIRDIRTDLGVPDLLVSIGVSGMKGWHPGHKNNNTRRTDIVDAQLAVANSTKYPEFEGTVASVETRDFYREKQPVSPGGEIYHWNNNCESYWLIGKAMGEAMVDLIRNQNKPRQP
jgi:alpha-galactosidase